MIYDLILKTKIFVDFSSNVTLKDRFKNKLEEECSRWYCSKFNVGQILSHQVNNKLYFKNISHGFVHKQLEEYFC
jgi:hypothetical protein